MTTSRTALLLCLALSLAACGQQVKRANEIARPDAEEAAEVTPITGAHSATHAPAQPAVSNADQVAGTIVETMDAGGYTYVLIDSGSEQVWAAAPVFAAAVGQQAVAPRSMPMKGFKSNTLGRTFELVYFCDAISVSGAAGAVADSGGDAPAPAPAADVTAAAGELTVEAVHQQCGDLAGQQVAFRGEVVKWNPAIMGRNWLHVQDGSGGPGTNDLTVTTQDEVAVGDQVLVRGTLNLDRDFGAGYVYELIVEEATVVRQ